MNKIRKILLSILSIPMVLSNSVSHASNLIEVIYDGKKIDFDEQKMNEAKNLLNRVNDKFKSTTAELREVKNDLNFYGINIDDASTYKKVIEVLKENNTLNCKSIGYIVHWVSTYFGTSEVDFVIKNCANPGKVYSYIEELKQLKKLKEVTNSLSPEEKEKTTKEVEEKEQKIKKDYERYSILDNPDYIYSCMTLINEIGVSNGAKEVLISCRELHNVNDVRNVLSRLTDILRTNFSNESSLCADTLLPQLNKAVNLKSENSRYSKALKRDLNYWYGDQWGCIKRLGNFISFADTSEQGKANRAIDNYIEELKTALGEGSSSSHVGVYLFLGIVIIGDSVYYLYKSVDGEYVLEEYTQNYKQENENDDDFDE